MSLTRNLGMIKIEPRPCKIPVECFQRLLTRHWVLVIPALFDLFFEAWVDWLNLVFWRQIQQTELGESKTGEKSYRPKIITKSLWTSPQLLNLPFLKSTQHDPHFYWIVAVFCSPSAQLHANYQSGLIHALSRRDQLLKITLPLNCELLIIFKHAEKQTCSSSGGSTSLSF